MPPHYLLIDFHVPLNAAQAEAVKRLFESRFEQVVEFGGGVQAFTDGDVAMKYILARE